jgi:hypothetical protein
MTMPRPRHPRPVIAVLSVVIALVACGNQSDGARAVPATEPPESEPTIVGFITEVAPHEPTTDDCVDTDPQADPDSPVSDEGMAPCSDSQALGTVLVEEDPAAQSGDDKISFTVDHDSDLLTETADGSYDAIPFSELVDGQAVSAWADGPIAESYPAQARAAVIVVRPN